MKMDMKQALMVAALGPHVEGLARGNEDEVASKIGNIVESLVPGPQKLSNIDHFYIKQAMAKRDRKKSKMAT